MKRIVSYFLLTFLTGSYLMAQPLLGPKAGLGASWVDIDESIDHSGNSYTFDSDKALFGVHIGLFSRFKIGSFYVQPEALFTHSQGKVKLNSETSGDEVRTLKYDKFDFPILFGRNFGNFRIQAGPSFTLLLKEDARETDVYPYIKENYNNATIGYQAGIGLDLGDRFILDLKYESDLQSFGESIKIGNEKFNTDIRNSQVILSLGYTLISNTK